MGVVDSMPSLGRGWSFLLPILDGSESVEMGCAKISAASGIVGEACEGGVEASEGVEIVVVGAGMGAVRRGCSLGWPSVSSVDTMVPDPGVHVLTRIWAVPDETETVMTFAVDIRRLLAVSAREAEGGIVVAVSGAVRRLVISGATLASMRSTSVVLSALALASASFQVFPDLGWGRAGGVPRR